MKSIKKPLYKRIFTLPRASFFMVFLLVAVTAYALFAPIIPATYNKPEILNADKLVAGKTLTYKIYACRYVSDAVVTTVTRKLVSTTDKQLAPVILSSDTLTNDRRCLETTKTLIIPSSTPAGDYQLIIQGIYQIIPLRKPIAVTATSDSFYIKKADPTTIIIEGDNKVSDPVGGSSSSQNPKANETPPPAPISVTPSKQNQVATNTPSKPVENNPTPEPPRDTETEETPPPSQGLIPDLLRQLTGINLLPLKKL